jgi:heme/copper-type cytochrome/quinol oxidase subunit 2
MKGTLVVDTPADYQAWLKERAELAGTQNAPPAGAPKTEKQSASADSVSEPSAVAASLCEAPR